MSAPAIEARSVSVNGNGTKGNGLGQLGEFSPVPTAAGKNGASLHNGHSPSVTSSEGARRAGGFRLDLLTLRSPDDSHSSFAAKPLSNFIKIGGVSGVMEMLASAGGKLETNQRGDLMTLAYPDGSRLSLDTFGGGNTVRFTQRSGKEDVLIATMEDPVIDRRITGAGRTKAIQLQIVSRPVVELNPAGELRSGQRITALKFDGGRVSAHPVDISDTTQARTVATARGFDPEVRVFADVEPGVSTTVYLPGLPQLPSDQKDHTPAQVANMITDTGAGILRVFETVYEPVHQASTVMRKGAEALPVVEQDVRTAQRLLGKAERDRRNARRRVRRRFGKVPPKNYETLLVALGNAGQARNYAAGAGEIARQDKRARRQAEGQVRRLRREAQKDPTRSDEVLEAIADAEQVRVDAGMSSRVARRGKTDERATRRRARVVGGEVLARPEAHAKNWAVLRGALHTIDHEAKAKEVVLLVGDAQTAIRGGVERASRVLDEQAQRGRVGGGY